MSFKTLVAAALLTAAASTAIAQTAQQPTQPAQPRSTTPATPAQPAAPAQPARPAAAQPAQPAAPAAQPARPAAAPAAPVAAGAVNLNTATKEQLETLPQIGPARADAIIAKRPYRDWNDFVAKNVVPSNAEREIQTKVRFR